MSATGKLALLALVALPASGAVAQERALTIADVPAIDRQRPHFYQALAAPGQAVQAAWTATPRPVPLDGEVELRLTVTNAANPHELRRPDLAQQEAFTRHFQVVDRPDLPMRPDANEVVHVWLLRPREQGPVELPRLEYAYYRPDLKVFRTTLTGPLTIVVEPPAPKSDSAPPVPLDAPESFLVIASERPTVSPGRFGWLVPVAGIPFAVVGWVLVWRRLFPDAVRLAKLRRNRAVRTALDRLRREDRSPDPAGLAGTVFRQYLTARFGVPPTAQTPAEIGAALEALELPLERADAAEQLLRQADAARFAGRSADGQALIHATESLIRAWEGEPA